MSKSKFKVGDAVKFRRFYPSALANQCDPKSDRPVYGRVYRISEFNSYGTVFVDGIKSSGYDERELMFADIRKEIETGCFYNITFASKKDRDKLEHDYRLACLELNNAYADQAQVLLDARNSPSYIDGQLGTKVYSENESLRYKFQKQAEGQTHTFAVKQSPAKKLVDNSLYTVKLDYGYYEKELKNLYKVDYKAEWISPDKVGDFFERATVFGVNVYELKKEFEGYILREVGRTAFWHYHEQDISKVFANCRDEFKKIENPNKPKTTETLTPVNEDKVGDKFVNNIDKKEYTLTQNSSVEYGLTRLTDKGDTTTRAGWHKSISSAFGVDKRSGFTKIQSAPEKDEDKVGDAFYLPREGEYYVLTEKDGKYALLCNDADGYNRGYTRCGWYDTISGVFTGIYKRNAFTKVDINTIPDSEGATYKETFSSGKSIYTLVKEDNMYILKNVTIGTRWYSPTKTIAEAFAPNVTNIGGRDKFTRIG